MEKPQKIPSLISLMCSGKHVERGEGEKEKEIEMKSCVQHNSKALIFEQRFYFLLSCFVISVTHTEIFLFVWKIFPTDDA